MKQNQYYALDTAKLSSWYANGQVTRDARWEKSCRDEAVNFFATLLTTHALKEAYKLHISIRRAVCEHPTLRRNDETSLKQSNNNTGESQTPERRKLSCIVAQQILINTQNALNPLQKSVGTIFVQPAGPTKLSMTKRALFTQHFAMSIMTIWSISCLTTMISVNLCCMKLQYWIVLIG